MRVMQILPRMNIGGVERGVYDLAKFFKGKDITTIIVSGGGRLANELEDLGIKHYKLPVYRKSLFGFFLAPKIRKIIEDEKIDIVHARSRVPGWISFFASRSSRAHFITTAHGIYKNRFFSEVMGWGKFIIAPSKVVARHMRDRFGVPEDKIKIISRWVDLDKFNFTEYKTRRESNYIVSVGRISQSKGYEHLIKGFKKVVRFNPYLKLKIIGSADKSKQRYLEYLKTLVNRFSLNYNVEFVGFKQDIEDVLAKARILVAPSVIEESFGRVVVEAFACGVPVVATAVGGFKEIIQDGKNGVLVEPEDGLAISKGILRILDDSSFAERIVKQAREDVERKYTMEECLLKTKEVYEETTETLRILVIKISSLGDLILSLPSLKALRDEFPRSFISLLTLKKYRSFFYDCPYIDEVITLEDKYKRVKNIFNIASILRRRSFDYVVDLQNNRSSHLISFLSFPRQSFGYSLRGGFLLTRNLKYNRQDSPLLSQEKILRLLGIKFVEKKLIFWPQESEHSIVLPAADLIGINISASRKWQSKNWPREHILKLIDLIHKNFCNSRVVLFGDEDSKEEARRIETSSLPSPLNLCGKTTLRTLPQVMKSLKLFITPDTATLHLSLALGVPTIALFGPTNPSRHTVQCKNLYVLCEKMPCSFCYRSKCGLDKKNACLTKITPGKVLIKIKEILNR
ncbi:MAG: glycosyltransferase [Candidatus Omnitrophica bacterium]|nr:glycosyltransferase [Candidatus Omnitrophota bacterium]